VLSARLRRLLWLLAINGALLGVEGVIQRLSGTDKLLWLVGTRINASAESQFAPTPTAATPRNTSTCSGRNPGLFGGRCKTPPAVSPGANSDPPPVAPYIIALCRHHGRLPIISGSRAGGHRHHACVVLAGCILLFALRTAHGATKFGVFLFLLTILGFGIYFGGDQLVRRMRQFDQGLEEREQTYAAARPMAKEHPCSAPAGNFQTSFFNSTAVRWMNTGPRNCTTTGSKPSSPSAARQRMIGLAFVLAVTRWFLPAASLPNGRSSTMLWLR